MRGVSGGLLLTLLGFVLLSLGDAVVKSMAGLWPPTAIAMLRYLLGASGLVVLLAWREGWGVLLRPPRPAIQLLRGLSVSLATISFFSAIFLMPLAEAATITFTSSIIIAALAAVFLRESAGRVTWAATLIAFCGVLIVLRPNFAELGLAALLPLGTALAMSILFVCNRYVAGQASALAMQAYVALAASPLLVVATLAGHYSGFGPFRVGLPDVSVLARCALVAFTATSGHWLIYLGTARAGAAQAAPMAYGQLLVAGTLGWLWFSEAPDLTALAGAGIIVASGIWLWRTDRMRAEPA